MLLVQLTALVVWLAQYVSAADAILLDSLYPGDALMIKTSALMDGLDAATFFYDVGPATEPGIEFKSEPEVKFCPSKSFTRIVSTTNNWMNVNEWHYFVKSETGDLTYYLD